jgi:hypothetical protein
MSENVFLCHHLRVNLKSSSECRVYCADGRLMGTWGAALAPKKRHPTRRRWDENVLRCIGSVLSFWSSVHGFFCFQMSENMLLYHHLRVNLRSSPECRVNYADGGLMGTWGAALAPKKWRPTRRWWVVWGGFRQLRVELLLVTSSHSALHSSASLPWLQWST